MPFDQDLAPEYLKRKTPPVEAMPEEVFLETGGTGTSPFASPPAAATDPLASGIPGAPLAQQPPFTLQAGAPPQTPPVAGPPPIVPSGFRGTEVADQPPPTPAPPSSTGQQLSDFLTGIGLKGIRPVAPVQGLVDTLYGQDPAKESNPVYRTLQRLAPMVDTALTALNVPITGVGDIANVLFAPLTIGLRQAGLPEEQVQQFVESTRIVPELAAGLSMGAPGALGTLGKVGNLEGMTAETSRLVQSVVENVMHQPSLVRTQAGELRLLNATKAKAGDQPTRVYHGTSQTFEQFDPAKADQAALYGPGHYFTEEPQVASGYATPRDAQTATFRTRAEAQDFAKKVGGGSVSSLWPGVWQVEYRDPASTAAPQVRPAYLDIRQPFDIDARIDPAEVTRLLTDSGHPITSGENLAQMLRSSNLTGEGVYGSLEAHLGSRAAVNAFLQREGYDGITHIGGKIMGGEPHRVWIAFSPEQIVSPFEYAVQMQAQQIVADAVSGKLNAPLLRTEAGVAHKDALVVVSRAIAGAATGSFVGDTWEERAKNALIGLGVGAAASPALVKRIAKAAQARSLEESAAIRATESLDPLGAVVQPATPHVTPLPATDIERQTFLQAMGEALPSREDVPGGLPPKLIQVNWATLRSPETVDATLDAIVKMRPIESRVITQEESRAMARELGLTTQQMLDMIEVSGGDAARVQAMRDLVVAARNKTADLANRVDAMVKGAPGYTETDAAFRQQLGVYAALVARAFGRFSEMGRAFNLLKGFTQEVGDVAGTVALAHKDLSGVPTETLVAQFKSLPPTAHISYVERLLAAGEVSIQTASWAYLNSLLMTFEGATANLLGNLTLLAENPLLKAGAAGIGTGREGIARLLGYDGEINRVYHGESFATLIGNLIHVPEALVAAGQIIKTGESQFGGIAKETPRFKPTGEIARSVMDRIPSLVKGMAGFTPDTYSDAAVRLATTLIELPNRVLLMAPDEFAKVLNYRGSTWSQAYNQVEKEFAGQPFAPLRSQAAADRFLEIVRNPDAAMRQIATGKTESVGDIATRSANVNTLNEPLGGRLGSLAEGLSHPLVRMTVAPFFKVPVNLFRMNVEHVPVLGLAVKRAREDWAAGGAQRDLLLAKWALGGGLMSFAAVHALTGDLTGGGPRDPALKREWLDAGFQSYGWRIGDKVISYNRFDVLGSLVGMTTAYVELRPYMRPDEADQIGSAMILAGSDNMLSKTFVRSASEWLQLLMSRDPKDLSTNKLLRSFAGGFVPSGVAQIERHQDPALRAVYSLLDEVASRVPGYSKHLFPRLNWLTGKPQVAPQGWAPEWLPGWVSVFSPIKVTEVTKDPVVRELLDHEIGIAALPPYIYGSNPEAPLRKPDATQGIPLSPEQHYWYQRLAATTEIKGKTLKDALESLIQSPTYQRLTDGPHGSKADLIHGLVTSYREKARMELIEKYPDLAQEWREKVIDQGVLKGGESLRPRLEKSTEHMLRGLSR